MNTQTATPSTDTNPSVDHAVLSPSSPHTPDGDQFPGQPANSPVLGTPEERVRQAFEQLHELLNSPADVALELIKRALESDAGKSYIAQALANNIEFRQRMQNDLEMPARDFSNLKIELSDTRQGLDWSPARLYAENDPINPDTLATYGTQDGTSYQEQRWLPEVEQLVRDEIKRSNFQTDPGKVFYVRVSPGGRADDSTPAQDPSVASDETAATSA